MRMRRSGSQNTVSVGEWPGRCRTSSVRSRSSRRSPSRSRRVTPALEPQARKARETERSAYTTSAGIPWRSISASANSSSRSASSP